MQKRDSNDVVRVSTAWLDKNKISTDEYLKKLTGKKLTSRKTEDSNKPLKKSEINSKTSNKDSLADIKAVYLNKS